jgi:arginyl-tRNA synthetase
MENVKSAVKDCLKALKYPDAEVVLTRPDPKFGDFSTNVALQLAKQAGKAPREIAEELQKQLAKKKYEAEVAGPGFLNIRLSDIALKKLVTAAETVPQPLAGLAVVAEYSDPNPFKVLHAGHLYTTIIGDAVANVLEAAGAKVHRVNFGGDVGLHVGKTMWAIIHKLGGEHPEKLDAVKEDARLEWLSERYVEGNSAYEDDENTKAEIIAYNKQVYDVHASNDHQSAFSQIYWLCRAWSYEGFDALYEQLQVQPFEAYMPESEVTPAGLRVAEKAFDRGILEKSEGAIVYKGEDDGLHTRVFINSAGLPTYEAKDLGLAATKWERFKFDRSFIITANDIVEYMKVVMKVLSNFYPEATERTKHLTHGVIKLPGGVKMSSRKGNILRAVDILDAAREANKKATGKDDEDVVLGAVKYAFLKQRIGGDIIYDPAESVSVEGNSGPYLQYAFARACSIMKKAGGKTGKAGDDFTEFERTLAVKISEFPEVVSVVLQEYMPHHICTYLYELTQVFNRFYENERVVGDPRESQRLALLITYRDVLKQGLTLLGIPAPESM